MIELTIAIPAFNMERCLAENLNTYVNARLIGSTEILILNNSSTDRTSAIAAQYALNYPELFTAINKPNKGYGSSVNWAIKVAKGRYFRVIDADDFVNTEELVLFLEQLKTTDADVVETPYTLVQNTSGQRKRVPLPAGRQWNQSYPVCSNVWQMPFPCLHSTTFRTAILQEHQIQLLEDTYFVDEEFMIRPFLFCKSVCYFPNNVYCYVIGNTTQSTSPQNRIKYQSHRQRVITRVLEFWQSGGYDQGAQEYCQVRIQSAIGDHLTTLLLYETNRSKGRIAANSFLRKLKKESVLLSHRTQLKYYLLLMANRLHLSLSQYERVKGLFKKASP